MKLCFSGTKLDFSKMKQRIKKLFLCFDSVDTKMQKSQSKSKGFPSPD